MATDTTALTPVEIDTELARIWGERASVQAQLDAARRSANRSEKNARNLAGRISDLESRVAAFTYEASPYNEEFARRGGWNRYFLVKNANGHVHRGTNCSTCFIDTQYGWLIDLADCDENAMIEEWGERACTVCFPDAPVNPFYNRPARIDREAQEARAAEKAAKDAAKAEKAIFDIDGSPLKDSHGYPLKTKVAARNELSSAFQSLVYYGVEHPDDYVAQIRRLAVALEAAGVDWKKVPGNAIKKAVKGSTIPPNNPYRLTPEQIAEHDAKIQDNQVVALKLAKEVIG